MENQFSLTFYCSTERWNPKNCKYPYKVTVRTEEELREVVCFDHVFVKFKDNRRSNQNFEYADLLVLDCDNDHSDSRKDWIWPDDLADMIPGVSYVTYSSRHDNVQKGEKSPRPRFHAIFPIDRVTDAEEYASLKRKTGALYPFFDQNAMDAGRFFFATDAREVLFQPGEINLTRFLALQESVDPEPSEKRIIPEGERNSTLYTKGIKVLTRLGNTEVARKTFLEAAACCVPSLPENEVSRIWSNANKSYARIRALPSYVLPAEYAPDKPQEWEEPIPLQEEALPEFPVDTLPIILREYILALSESLQTSPDMPAACTLGVLSVCLQGKYAVRINADWVEQINLYSLVIAEPSEKKSPCLKQMTYPILRFEELWNSEHEEEITATQRMKRILMKKAEYAENACSHNKMSKEEADAASHEALAYQPVRKLRIFLDDVTPEALNSHLSEYDGICTIMSAEGGVFENFAGRYSGKNNIDTALKAYSGDPVRVDRKGSPPETIPNPSMTILMMIQPAVLSTIMGNPMFHGQGLTARFLYCLPESRVGSRNVNPATVPPEIRQAYESFILQLLQSSSSSEKEEITLSAEAEQARLTFAADVERRLLYDLTDIRDWSGKIVGTTVRIAALICRAEAGPEGDVHKEKAAKVSHYEISSTQMIRAIRIANYYIEHAKAAFRKMGIEMLISRCERSLAAIRRLQLTSISKRDLMRACRFLQTSEEARRVLDHLEDYGYIRCQNPETRSRVGRPGNPVYDVNPLTLLEN